MTTDERLIEFLNSEEYAKYWSRRVRNLQCEREEGRDEGIELGQNQGEESKTHEIVLNMANNGFTIEQISVATNLSEEKIKTIIENSKE